jgi:glycosyltransferase involved in cell wall biosynthesis
MTPEITVSVCIPTRPRPGMLRQCVRSALGQTILSREIVIGDDSDDDRTERLVGELDLPATIGLSYLRNRPPAGAAHNIDSVFRRATSDWLLLIHDDDWLLPRTIEYLTSPHCQGAAPDLIYGNQQIADAEGSIDNEVSARINPAFARTPERAGLQPTALWAAARQQLPNDGFLARSRLVRDVGYLSDGVLDCEYAFGVEAAAHGAAFFVVGSRRSRWAGARTPRTTRQTSTWPPRCGAIGGDWPRSRTPSFASTCVRSSIGRPFAVACGKAAASKLSDGPCSRISACAGAAGRVLASSRRASCLACASD